MPRVIIQMHRGRSIEQKRELVRKITSSVADVLHVDANRISILIQESEPTNAARGGVLDSERDQSQTTAADSGSTTSN